MELDDLMAAMRATAARKPKPVHVDGWGDLFARAVTVDDVEEQTADLAAKGDKKRMARAAIRVICREDGSLIFDPLNEEHVELIGAQPWTMMQKVLAAAEVSVPN